MDAVWLEAPAAAALALPPQDPVAVGHGVGGQGAVVWPASLGGFMQVPPPRPPPAATPPLASGP